MPYNNHHLLAQDSIISIFFNEYEFNKQIKLYDCKLCIICLDAKPNIIFDKCVHSCYCVTCYEKFIKINYTVKCPLCREFFIISFLSSIIIIFTIIRIVRIIIVSIHLYIVCENTYNICNIKK